MLSFASRIGRHKPIVNLSRRYTSSVLSPLPPVSEWADRFKSPKTTKHWTAVDLVTLANSATAKRMANAFLPDGSKDKIVIEAFPGPGMLTRALLQLPKKRLKRLIVLEDYEPYLKQLKPLESDPRVTVINQSAAHWQTFTDVEKQGLLADVSHFDWSFGEHPHFHFVTHLPSNAFGEQLISQIMRFMPERSWLFKFGRVPMSFMMSDYVWQRMLPPESVPGMKCKLSIITEAVAHCSAAVSLKHTEPYEEHFFPRVFNFKVRKKLMTPFRAVNITPLEHQTIKTGLLDKWDYCLRRMFVKRKTSTEKALSLLGPGAQAALGPKISDGNLPPSSRIELKTLVSELTIAQWQTLVEAFDKWPFAPEDLDLLGLADGEFSHNLTY